MWVVVFDKAIRRENETSRHPSPSPLVERLVAQGVNRNVARELVQQAPAERIQRQLEVFEWMRARNDKRVAKNPPGFLVSAIRGDFLVPSDYARPQHRTPVRAATKAAVPPDAERSEARAVVESFWNGLPAEEKGRIESAAMSSAVPHLLQGYERSESSGHKATAESYHRLIVDRYILDLLAANGK
jgi:hypothetical protein